MKDDQQNKLLHDLSAEDTIAAQSAIQYLLESKQHRVDERSDGGLTPLHIAAAADNFNACQLLLSFGADPFLVDEQGRTPFEMATGRTKYFFKRKFYNVHNSGRFRVNLMRTFRRLFSCTLFARKDQKIDGSVDYARNIEHNHLVPNSLCSEKPDIPNRVLVNNRLKNGCYLKPHGENRGDSFGTTTTSCISSAETSFATAKSGSSSSPSPQKSPQKTQLVSYDESHSTPAHNNFAQWCSKRSFEPEKKASVFDHMTDDSDSFSEEEDKIPSEISLTVSQMSNKQLKNELASRGVQVGPLMQSTRGAYEKKLARLIVHMSSYQDNRLRYSSSLERVISGYDCSKEGKKLDEVVIADFFAMGSQLCREGKRATSFCYLLLDPSLIDVPHEASFKDFVQSIFYVGKGKRARPLEHLVDAVRYKNLELASSPKTLLQESAKLKKINEIWSNGYGVVSLHIFQNTIPVEAFTREAAMIDAIGVSNLTNMKRGDYYGESRCWDLRQKTIYGAYLLTKTLKIFHVEGCRQLYERDVTNL